VNDAKTIELLEKVNRALNLLVKLQVSALQGDRKQKDMILFLDQRGCKSAEIADYLGATSTTVSPILSRAHSDGKSGRKSKGKKKAKAKRRNR
jgi:DNA-binding MarR family transcriptional regulator